MHWIHDYQLFLFDFDGLLVNTEEIHFQAYQNMCAKYGCKLEWNFSRYIQAAHYSAHGLKEQIYAALPQLYQIEPNWDVLYDYKRKQVIELLNHHVPLMPGVEKLLQTLKDAAIQHCVVTHSPLALVNVIKKQHPILQEIPHWITREDYTHAKPHPEGYLLAIERFAKTTDAIIGFEDTPRGIEALLKTRAKPVLISSIHYPEISAEVTKFTTFEHINESI